MSYIEDEGKVIGDALGVRYDGPQYYKEDFKFHLFTDPLTGFTFAGTSLEDSKKRLGKMRRQFGISQEKSPSTHPLVLERFPYPAPEQMGLDIGGIGELKVEIPPPRGSKLEEGSVIRTSEKHDKAVEHLGYHSVSLSDDEISLLETKVPTDIDVINESQNRLRETKIIPDDQLSSAQLGHLNLARAIAKGVGCIPPAGIYAAVIPPASDRVRTAGLYGTKSGALYLSIDMLSKGRDAFDTLVHELGHHRQFTSSGEAEDLTPSHAEAMTDIAKKLIQGLNSGDYDKLLVDTQY